MTILLHYVVQQPLQRLRTYIIHQLALTRKQIRTIVKIKEYCHCQTTTKDEWPWTEPTPLNAFWTERTAATT